MSHSKLEDQTKGVKRSFDNSTHSFFRLVADAIAAKIKQDTGLELELVGKEASKNGMSATLVGQATDPERIPDIEQRVHKTMQGLKNPSNLTDLLR